MGTDCVKDLVAIPHFHVDFLFPHEIKLLWLIRKITYSFCIRQSTDATLIRSRLK
jgi:hypothetical protein